MRSVFDNDKSNVCSPGPRIGLRGAVPYVVLRAKASVLNQRVGVRSSRTGVWPGTAFGRRHKASAFQVSPLCTILTGEPLASVITPPNDHPPAIRSIARSNFLPPVTSQT